MSCMIATPAQTGYRETKYRLGEAYYTSIPAIWVTGGLLF